MRLCLGCMQEIPEQEKTCPYCGFNEGMLPDQAYYLVPGTVLMNKYIVGKVLGSGGFGVTYIGWDYQLERKVAIKEYFPSNCSTRSRGDTQLTIYSRDAEDEFISGLKSFIDEAKKLAQFDNTPGIVGIYNSFMENGTGYIVMEYVPGKSVKDIMKAKGPYSFEEALPIICSILEGLSIIHKVGIIHRDIAPDNIYITDDGKVKLLDFGAARLSNSMHSKSLSVVYKKGYAPMEQYDSHGKQGPWTDVYATGATFYRMITGKMVPEASLRVMKDELIPPSKMGIKIPPNIEISLLNSLNIMAENRTQTAQEFLKSLNTDHVERKKEVIQRQNLARFPKWMKILAASLGGILIVAVLLFATGVLRFSENKIAETDQAAVKSNEVNTPGVVNLLLEDAEKSITDNGLKMQITGKEFSDKTPENKVMEQDPAPGKILLKDGTVNVVASAGVETVMLEDYTGTNANEVEKQLTEKGLKVVKQEEFNDTAAMGTIISQSTKGGEELAVGETLTVVVSKGSEEEFEKSKVKIPNLKNLTYKKAKSVVKKKKLTIEKIKEVNNSKVPKGCVISQTPKAKTEGRTGDTVKVVVSLGPKMVRVPDVQYKTEAQAKEMLQDVGLNYNVVGRESETVQEGNVIEQAVKAKKEVKPGTSVTIYVSTGAPDPVNTQGDTNRNTDNNNRATTQRAPATTAPKATTREKPAATTRKPAATTEKKKQEKKTTAPSKNPVVDVDDDVQVDVEE